MREIRRIRRERMMFKRRKGRGMRRKRERKDEGQEEGRKRNEEEMRRKG